MESRSKFTMCRLCLCVNQCFINIFELNDWQGYVAAEVITNLLQFQVSETDGYPHVVCSKCLEKLTDFKLFKECCRKSKVKYDNMRVSSARLEENQPEMVEFMTVKVEPIFYSDNEDNVSKATINAEEVIINSSPDKASENPFQETEVSHGPNLLKYEALPLSGNSHTQDDVTFSWTSDYSSASADPACSNAERISSDLITPEITIKEEPLEDGAPSRMMEMSEGQWTSPEERRYMTPLIQEDIGIGVEVRKERRRRNKEVGGEVKLACAPEKGLEGEREGLECYHCGKVLMTKRSLTRHMMLHGFGRTYDCDVCGKAFQSKFILMRHSLIHTGSKPYKCEECSQCFSQNSSLKQHIRLHTGFKPHKCSECSKCFTHTSSLNAHMTSHTGSKLHKCAECGKSFSSNSNLKKHMRSHMRI